MKIKPDDMVILSAWVRPVLETNNTKAVIHGYIAGSLTPKRFRWDALYASKLKIGDGVGTQGHVNLYAYMDDEHIDTALREICQRVGGSAGRAAGKLEWLDPEESDDE